MNKESICFDLGDFIDLFIRDKKTLEKGILLLSNLTDEDLENIDHISLSIRLKKEVKHE